MRIPHAITILVRLPGRLARAIRYYTRLNYTWHLSWVKAERT